MKRRPVCAAYRTLRSTFWVIPLGGATPGRRAAAILARVRPRRASPRYAAPSAKAYRAIDRHAVERLCRWLCKKHKTPGRGGTRFPDEHLYQELRLKRLSLTTRNLPWAKA